MDYPIAIGKCEDSGPAGRSSSTANTFSGTESKLDNYIYDIVDADTLTYSYICSKLI